MDKRPIGIFDSGAGGLTVLKEIIRQVPNEDFIYFGDTARFPYGTRNLEDVREYAFKITQLLVKKGIKLLVIACNTASAAALEELRKNFSIPIVGVIEPGARAAASITVVKKVGVIATNSTISSRAYDIAMAKIDPGIELFSMSASPLVDYIERGILNGRELQEKITGFVNPLINQAIDVLVLGCTHFPLIEKEIGKCCGLQTGEDVRLDIVSSALETAKDVKKLLDENSLKNISAGLSRKTYFETGSNSKFLEIGKLFLGDEIKEVAKVNINMQ